MKTVLLAVGRLRPAYRALMDDYAGRLTRYGDFAELEVREASSAPTVDVQLRDEAGRLTEKLPAGAQVVALDRMGDGWSSEALAQRLNRWRELSRPLAVVIGGSHGLAPDFLARADARWSLGPATLPHELARVVAVEQLYRAWTIVKGEKYHK